MVGNAFPGSPVRSTAAALNLAVLLTVLLAVLLAVSGCSAGAADPVRPAAVGGFRVELDHREHSRTTPVGPRVDWQTSWRLSWEPVPDATSYAVWYGTAESGGDTAGTPKRIVREPGLVVEAGAGTSEPARLDLDRETGLSLTASQLLVAVAAIDHDGNRGDPSRFFPVGEVPATGVPIGQELAAGHDH